MLTITSITQLTPAVNTPLIQYIAQNYVTDQVASKSLRDAIYLYKEQAARTQGSNTTTSSSTDVMPPPQLQTKNAQGSWANARDNYKRPAHPSRDRRDYPSKSHSGSSSGRSSSSRSSHR